MTKIVILTNFQKHRACGANVIDIEKESNKIVVGPKDIPKFLRQIGKLSKSIKKISREFKSSLNEIADETDIKDFKNSINEVKNLKKDFDIKKNFKNEIDSIKETANLLENDEANLLENDEPQIKKSKNS